MIYWGNVGAFRGAVHLAQTPRALSERKNRKTCRINRNQESGKRREGRFPYSPGNSVGRGGILYARPSERISSRRCPPEKNRPAILLSSGDRKKRASVRGREKGKTTPLEGQSIKAILVAAIDSGRKRQRKIPVRWSFGQKGRDNRDLCPRVPASLSPTISSRA